MDKMTILRILLAIASLVKLFGVEIPEEAINSIADIIASGLLLWAVYKNNSITKEAIQADKYLKQLKISK